MTLRETQSTFAKNFAEFISWLYSEGYEVTFGEAYRTSEQAEWYKKTGFSKAGLKSLHCSRLAFDINIFKNGNLLSSKDLTDVGMKWESMHPYNSWGGFFKGFDDYPHFSMGIEKPERTR